MNSANVMNQKKYFFTYLGMVFLIAFALFFFRYTYPNGPFWDENYHIASAQKYVNGVYFMEPHPPLGKLIMALGEALIAPNKGIDTAPFLSTDYISTFPDQYSFAGMRFFPILFSACSALFFFMILYRLSVSIHYALLFSAFYLFDNALIVHLRGAMLEGIQIFFILAAVYYFIELLRKKEKRKVLEYFILGLLAGLAVSVKLNSAVVLLLFVFLAYEDYGSDVLQLKITKEMIITFTKKTLSAAAGILIVFFISFYIHFAIAGNVMNGRFYQASEEYKSILSLHENADPLRFFTMLRDYVGYMQSYEKGVPKWDPSKLDENGSPAFTWPFGYKSINYRWTKTDGKVAYLYLQGNPLIWLSALAGIALSLIYIGGRIFFKTPVEDKGSFKLIVYFSILYIVYMALMMSLERVMYLYHYFIPLIFSFFLAFLIFQHYFKEHMKTNDKFLRVVSIIIAAEIFCVFLFYAPFSYYIPLDSLDFIKRIWTKAWGLIPINF